MVVIDWGWTIWFQKGQDTMGNLYIVTVWLLIGLEIQFTTCRIILLVSEQLEMTPHSLDVVEFYHQLRNFEAYTSFRLYFMIIRGTTNLLIIFMRIIVKCVGSYTLYWIHLKFIRLIIQLQNYYYNNNCVWDRQTDLLCCRNVDLCWGERYRAGRRHWDRKLLS